MSTRPSLPLRGLAVSAAAIGAALVLLVPMGADAAPPVSQGEGRLLVATIGGTSSAPIAALLGAHAVDATGGGAVTVDTPLDATALAGILGLQAGTTNLFASNGIIKLGAVGQYAQARDDGSSTAFAGTVSSANSLVGVGTGAVSASTGFTAPSSGSVGIGLGDSAVTLGVTIGAVAAGAQQPTTGAASGSYVIDDVGVTVGGTVVTGLLTSLDSTLLDTTIASLNTLLALGSNPTITNPLTTTTTLTISASDLLAAAGVADFNHLAPGTDLLSFLPQAVLTKITSIATGLETTLTGALTTLGLSGLNPLVTDVTSLVSSLTTDAAALTGTALATALAALAQLKVNNKTTNSDGSFTQNALTVGIGAAGALASVQLANATVGPNTPSTVTPTPSSTPAAGSKSALAETGMDVPVVPILIGAALLAAAGLTLLRVAARRRRAAEDVAIDE